MLGRSEKEAIVGQVREKIEKGKAHFLTNLIGVSSNRANEIRKSVRDAQGTVVVARNTLFEKAAKGTPAEELLTGLKGANALAIAFEDAPGVAKVLYEAKEEDELVTLEKGLLDGRPLDKNELVSLAKLPSREVMLATFLATMQAPVSSFVRLMNAIKEDKDKGGQEGAEDKDKVEEKQN